MNRPHHQLFRGTWLLALLVLGAFSWQPAQSAGATTQEERAVSAAKALHRAGKYPSHLPAGRPAPRPTRGCSGDSQASNWQVPGITYAPWILLGLALFLLLITLLPRWMRKERSSPPDKVTAALRPHILGRSIDQEALEHYLSTEDWEGAICWLLYQAMRLVGWQQIGAGKGQTAREVVFQVPAQAPATPPLRELLQIAESVRFGGVKADTALFTKAQEIYQKVQTLLPTGTHNIGQTADNTGKTADNTGKTADNAGKTADNAEETADNAEETATTALPPTDPKPHDHTGAP